MAKADRGFALRGLSTTMWPGIIEPWCELCSWTWRDGVRQVKVINRACPAHGRLLG